MRPPRPTYSDDGVVLPLLERVAAALEKLGLKPSINRYSRHVALAIGHGAGVAEAYWAEHEPEAVAAVDRILRNSDYVAEYYSPGNSFFLVSLRKKTPGI